MDAAVLGTMIPIVAIVMGIGIGMLRLWLDYRNKREMFQMHHAERLAAIEKGIELPPLPPEFFQDYGRGVRTPARDLRYGLVLLLVGCAIFVALYAETGLDNAWWGLVPAAVGAAFLLFYALAGRKLRPSDPASSGTSSASAPGRGEHPPFRP